ncbi:hypothetical protein [Rhizobium sp. BE258]|uniref:virion core protein, T7 gp14 family n=1 Tax=Rhizobium sp. BE258 TaxID=2817722 RepID=UPI0028635988|nr:hypothetical protein [Rhizobium sp. BE258]MDR7145555.1 hypothetical protein [Rhizobium sp. BE258]
MCVDPISLIGFTISAASTAVGFVGESAAADEQNRMYQENAQRANQNARDQMFATQQRMLQEQEAGAAEKINTMKEARAAKATATVAAGESGVNGLSVEALLQEFDGRAASYNDRVDQNTDWTMNQLNAEMKGIRANAEDRINSVQRASKPSFWDAGLRIMGSGLDAYNTSYERQQKNPDTRQPPTAFDKWLTTPIFAKRRG